MKTKTEETKIKETIKKNLKAALVGVNALVQHFDHSSMTALYDTALKIREHVNAALAAASEEEKT